MKIPKILAIWQPVGYSTHVIAAKVAEKYGIKASHTGTLDPMAEGVIIVLTDEERNKKYEYAEWIKEYEFEMVLGLETDSFDGLGLAHLSETRLLAQRDVAAALTTFVGSYTQEIPSYSAIKVKGKPLHWYARNNKLDEIELPKRSGEILEIELLEQKKASFGEIVGEITRKIDLVTGNLRQKEVKQRWGKLKTDKNSNLKLPVAKIRVKMTKGLYVRSLAVDIAEKLGEKGFVYSLKRTKNGKYSKNNSKTLENVFGENYKQDYNFNSMLTFSYVG